MPLMLRAKPPQISVSKPNNGKKSARKNRPGVFISTLQQMFALIFTSSGLYFASLLPCLALLLEK